MYFQGGACACGYADRLMELLTIRNYALLLQFARGTALSAEDRRGFVADSAALAAAAAVVCASPTLADEGTAAPAAPPAKANYGVFPVPKDWGIGGKDYYVDAAKVVAHMEYATQVNRGACIIAIFCCQPR